MRKVILFGLLAAVACGGGGDAGGGITPPVQVDLVALSHTSANVQVGDSILVLATPRDASGNALAGRSVTGPPAALLWRAYLPPVGSWASAQAPRLSLPQPTVSRTPFQSP